MDQITADELTFAVGQAFESLAGTPLGRDSQPAPPLHGVQLQRMVRAVWDELDLNQLSVVRRLSSTQRLAAAFSMCDFARSLVIASIHSQCPGISETELWRRVRQRMRSG